MPRRLHPLMQDTNDLDHARFWHAIEDHMHGIRHPRLAALVTAMADVEAAKAGRDLRAIHR